MESINTVFMLSSFPPPSRGAATQASPNHFVFFSLLFVLRELLFMPPSEPPSFQELSEVRLCLRTKQILPVVMAMATPCMSGPISSRRQGATAQGGKYPDCFPSPGCGQIPAGPKLLQQPSCWSPTSMMEFRWSTTSPETSRSPITAASQPSPRAVSQARR